MTASDGKNSVFLKIIFVLLIEKEAYSTDVQRPNEKIG